MASKQAFHRVLTVWDGRWYLRIAVHGYPTSVPQGDFYHGTGRQVQSAVAFFPLYSLLMRGLDRVLPGGADVAGMVLALLIGAAGVAIWRDREWRAVVAPLLAPVGMLAFFGFLWWHTREPLISFRVESQGWGDRLDFGRSNLGVFADLVTRPMHNPNHVLLAL